MDAKAILFETSLRNICQKWGGVRFYANNAKYPVDVGDGIMIQLAPSNERNLSRLWDGSVS